MPVNIFTALLSQAWLTAPWHWIVASVGVCVWVRKIHHNYKGCCTPNKNLSWSRVFHQQTLTKERQRARESVMWVCSCCMLMLVKRGTKTICVLILYVRGESLWQGLSRNRMDLIFFVKTQLSFLSVFLCVGPVLICSQRRNCKWIRWLLWCPLQGPASLW